MKPFLRQQLARYADRLGELEFLLSRPDIMSDMTQFLALSREHTDVAAVAGRWQRYQQREADLVGAQSMLQVLPTTRPQPTIPRASRTSSATGVTILASSRRLSNDRITGFCWKGPPVTISVVSAMP